MLTIDDVARIFNVPPLTVKQWCEQGIIKASRTGAHGGPLFGYEDVAIAYLDESIRETLGR